MSISKMYNVRLFRVEIMGFGIAPDDVGFIGFLGFRD